MAGQNALGEYLEDALQTMLKHMLHKSVPSVVLHGTSGVSNNTTVHVSRCSI